MYNSLSEYRGEYRIKSSLESRSYSLMTLQECYKIKLGGQKIVIYILVFLPDYWVLTKVFLE